MHKICTITNKGFKNLLLSSNRCGNNVRMEFLHIFIFLIIILFFYYYYIVITYSIIFYYCHIILLFCIIFSISHIPRGSLYTFKQRFQESLSDLRCTSSSSKEKQEVRCISSFPASRIIYRDARPCVSARIFFSCSPAILHGVQRVKSVREEWLLTRTHTRTWRRDPGGSHTCCVLSVDASGSTGVSPPFSPCLSRVLV